MLNSVVLVKLNQSIFIVIQSSISVQQDGISLEREIVKTIKARRNKKLAAVSTEEKYNKYKTRKKTQ